MNAESSSFQTAYDACAALDYLASLHAPAEVLSFGLKQLAGERIQPTVGPHVAALLDVLVRALRPQRILEIGTSYGYSACVMGRAAASYGGKVWTVERSPRLAQAACENVAAVGLAETVTVLTGEAGPTLEKLEGSFGVILQDGGKDNYLPLLDSLVNRLVAGGVLISDDVLFPVMTLPASVAHWAKAIDKYNRRLAAYPALKSVWLPIGDGVALSVKLGDL
jgi:predicted O-methyltransferase YrrM